MPHSYPRARPCQVNQGATSDDLPKAQWLLGDCGYDADWFRDALQPKGIQPYILGRRSRNEPARYDKRRYRCRSRIEIMFDRLKDWRRVATRYDGCPTTFFAAVVLATTGIFWLWSTSPDFSAAAWRTILFESDRPGITICSGIVYKHSSGRQQYDLL
jgi:transposase